MAIEREKIEKRIYEILWYIKDEELISLVRENINIFSIEELGMVQNFLETWESENLYNLILWKIQEYKNILNELKNYNINTAKKKKLDEEENEKKEEEKELENILNF